MNFKGFRTPVKPVDGKKKIRFMCPFYRKCGFAEGLIKLEKKFGGDDTAWKDSVNALNDKCDNVNFCHKVFLLTNADDIDGVNRTDNFYDPNQLSLNWRINCVHVKPQTRRKVCKHLIECHRINALCAEYPLVRNKNLSMKKNNLKNSKKSKKPGNKLKK